MNTKAELFFEKANRWSEEYSLLRDIILENKSLKEDFKWKHPCYTYEGKNIIIVHGFKDYCALLFHKGVLIQDKAGILIQQTENVQSARQIRFTNVQQILELRTVIKKYIQEAIDIERLGKKLEFKKVEEYPMPEEFKKVLDDDEALTKAFHSLTPGRQKGYLFYFNQAKRSKTRESRIEKYYQHILDGKGINDYI
ncbi:YdeI/OmpD-associated family protein [Albibacterium indicum]|uniref:YdeI/OmpD-associated family protein n=1 Tax=Albibacterium indicum TaxID=2292082 RepID=UPI000E508FA1|nr:DUF1801 domain-containing protein [Pedobacter indicus]